MSKSIAKNAIYSGIRAMSTMLFPLITYPYAARVLTADGLGKVNFSAAIISYFTLIAGLGIVTYATREGAAIRRDKKELETFASQVFSINLASTLISLVLLVSFVSIWPKLREYQALLAIQSVGIVATSLGVEWVYNIFEDYGYITVRTIFVQIVSAVLMFIFVRKPEDFAIYCSIVTLSAAGANVFNLIHSRKYLNIRLTFHLNLQQHLIPLIVLFANTIAMSVYVNIDLTLIGAFYDDGQVGLYSLGGKIYTLSKTVFTAVGAVVIPRLSLYFRDDRAAYDRLIIKVFRCMILTLIPCVFGMICLSEYIVLIVGGVGYSQAVPVLKVLALALLPAVGSMCLTNMVLLPAGCESDCLKATTAGAVVNTILNIILLPIYGIISSAYATLFAELTVIAVCIWKSGPFIPGGLSEMRGSVMSTILCGVTFILITCFLSPHLGLNIGAFFLLAFAFVLTMGIVYAMRDEVRYLNLR